MSGVSDSFEPIPDPQVDAVFTKFDITAAQSSGVPYAKLEFTVTTPEYKGRKIWRNCSFDPKALWALKGALVAFGVPAETMETDFDVEELLEEYIGSEVTLDISINEYTKPDGSVVKNNQIRNVKPLAISSVF